MDPKKIRSYLVSLRNCASVYSNHLETLVPQAPPIVNLSRYSNGFNIFADAAEKNLNEKDIEILGPIAYQSDKTKSFSFWILEIEKQVKEDC